MTRDQQVYPFLQGMLPLWQGISKCTPSCKGFYPSFTSWNLSRELWKELCWPGAWAPWLCPLNPSGPCRLQAEGPSTLSRQALLWAKAFSCCNNFCNSCCCSRPFLLTLLCEQWGKPSQGHLASQCFVSVCLAFFIASFISSSGFGSFLLPFLLRCLSRPADLSFCFAFFQGLATSFPITLGIITHSLHLTVATALPHSPELFIIISSGSYSCPCF